MYLLGYDVGSSSVKASLINAETGQTLNAAFFPKEEMKITALQSGWAEQEPESWWENLKKATQAVLNQANIEKGKVKAIGISYQMHGLVAVDENRQVLRPSIIWCDSRAVEIGDQAFRAIGEEKSLAHLLNSPGNFTASKLKWVKENEPEIYSRIDKIMLPGDYIAMRLTGELNTTISGLSEGIMWDFRNNAPAGFLLDHYGIDQSLIPEVVPTFSEQGRLQPAVATELGLSEGIPVAYRAGDQPNNALSLNVLEPGEIAATAGTSGVVYGVSDEVKYDPQSRVNTFAHVNHSRDKNRLGVLLCVNGTGIQNSWLKHNMTTGMDYPAMNELAAEVPIGSDGLCVLPFGNGAERMLGNQNPGGSVHGLNFNRHTRAHVLRAAQEGIVFAFNYGMEVMKNMGISPAKIRAGHANMMLSPLFRQTLAGVSGAELELYNTDGSAGAARGAGIGAGVYSSPAEAFSNLEVIEAELPDKSKAAEYQEAYAKWKATLEKSV